MVFDGAPPQGESARRRIESAHGAIQYGFSSKSMPAYLLRGISEFKWLEGRGCASSMQMIA